MPYVRPRMGRLVLIRDQTLGVVGMRHYAGMLASDLDRSTLRELCECVGERILNAQDSSDFLGWHAGTMEYWIHAVLAAEARKLNAWASRTEVPYLTRAHVSSAKGEKWSDGAVSWPDKGFGALLEVKALVAHTPQKVKRDIRDKVAADLDALMGIDREATMARTPGKYEDPSWAAQRGNFERLYALQILLVHGTAADSTRSILRDALREGIAVVEARYQDAPSLWRSDLADAYAADPLLQRTGGEGLTAAVFACWAVPLQWVAGEH